MKFVCFVFVCVALISAVCAITCVNDQGESVAWWAALKYPNSGKYLYADAKEPHLTESQFDMHEDKNGALANTVSQIYGGGVGYMMYNDEPTTGDCSSIYGHSKGVVGWSLNSNGFWLVHSVPKFPSVVSQGYSGIPSAELIYAQSFLCISTNNVGLDTIGSQLHYNRPMVYDSSIPSRTPSNLNALANGSYVSAATFSVKSVQAINGDSFSVFSKTGPWDKALYSQLVAPTLQTGLLVETWIRGSKIPSSCGSKYPVMNIQSLSFPGREFTETSDHSKWGVSTSSSKPFVCIGGINQMTTQNKRGGGTVCISNSDLWGSFKSLVTKYEQC